MAHNPAYFMPMIAPFAKVMSQAHWARRATLTTGAMSVPAIPPNVTIRRTCASQQTIHRRLTISIRIAVG